MIYIYHHTDADGYASAATVITYLVLNNTITSYEDSNVRLIPFNYQKLDTFVPYEDIEFKKDDLVYVVDLSVSVGTLSKFISFLELLHGNSCNLTWIDHHRSSVDDSFNALLNNRFKLYGFERYIDIEYCAAYNAYSYLINHKLGYNHIPEIIRVIDDYDCWKLNLKGTKEFIVGFSLDDKQNPSNPNWYLWLTNRGACLEIIKQCITQGAVVDKWLKIDDSNKFKSSAFTTYFCGLKCCALNVRRNSDIFRTNEDYDLLLSYIYDGTNYNYSLYTTKDDVYCNKIAEMFGGGGHKKAAGFMSKKLVVKKNLSLIYRLKDRYRTALYNRKKG